MYKQTQFRRVGRDRGPIVRNKPNSRRAPGNGRVAASPPADAAEAERAKQSQFRTTGRPWAAAGCTNEPNWEEFRV
jgi:hypothetical protein